jgi:hypothetical protein
MRLPTKNEPGRQWVTTLSWPDKVIARCFPSFFNSYAPIEIKEQWAQYLEKKQRKGKEPPSESGGEGERVCAAKAKTTSDRTDSSNDKGD